MSLLEEFLGHALEQTHPLVRSAYTPAQLREHWRPEVETDAVEFFTDAFAEEFGGNCAALGLPAQMFKHRLLEAQGRRLIAGIRFFGMDLGRPFVEVARISRPLESDREKEAITELLRREFASFKPQRWRVYQSAHLPYQFAGCAGDKRYMLGFLEAIRQRPRPEGMDRLELCRARDLEFYPRYAAMYVQLFAERLWMPDVSRQESREDMAHYLETALVYEIFVDGQWAGVTVVSRSQDVGATGYYMIEIALEQAFRGAGLGVAVQRSLVELLEDSGGDALFGTIGAVNAPMLRTAKRVGRTDVGGHYFVNFQETS
ncbi:MAG: GNAT family protein [Meiothermus sp.]|nr:GNAT family protein [Meiothermus sp.]